MVLNIFQDWATRLQQQRRALKMTVADLALRAGVSKATANRVLSGDTTSCSFAHVFAVAAALGVNLAFDVRSPEDVVEEQVKKRAREVADMVQGTMALEGQGITDKAFLEELVETSANTIRGLPRKRLWGVACRSSRQSRAKRRLTTSPNSSTRASDSEAN